jgi:CheY-like chemotaxis protein/nitrogen-specific signal transduction histidine kinase
MMMERDSGQSKRVFETNTPVTERKVLEDNLRRQAAELVAADRNKDEFLALLAHELRNPLAPLRNALQILRQPDIAAPVLDRVRDVMGRQIHTMSRMVDELLDISRITLGRIELRKEPINLLGVVERAVEALRADLQERQQELVLSLPSEPVILEADAFRLQQILGNLLSNASKFSPPRGHIWLSVDETRSDREIVVRVRDDGIGIAPEHLSKIFDRFMQVDTSLKRATGGLGIGLTLVQHLVRLHGGTVAVHSAGSGQGAEFVVHLPPPLRTSQEVRRISEPAPPPAAEPPHARRVLVADDNIDAADTLGMLLRQHGHEVEIVYNGAKAVEVAATFHPEVIFLDLGMPIMDGFQTARRLRENLGERRVRLVAISGYGQVMERQRARGAGFDDFVVKPASPDRIIDLANRPLGEDSQANSAADD